MDLKMIMEQDAREELEREGAACREVMQHRKKNADGDLISRKALIAEYDRVHVGAPGGARKLMVDASAVDAVPVVEAFNVALDDGMFMCSACAWSDDDTSTCTTQDFNWCPNCGAKILF